MGHGDKGGDIEAGSGNGGNQLYPGMTEMPELRWTFIRKVYSIISLQLILTAFIAAIVINNPDVPRLKENLFTCFAVYLILFISVTLILIPLQAYQKNHPLNLILLTVFTVVMGLLVGFVCVNKEGPVLFMAAILTSTVVVGLTLYTFWAVKRGQDFSFLGPFLFCILLLLIVFSLIQILFPMGKLIHTMWCLVGALVFSGFIVYDTDNLIKNFTYDEYVGAAVCLYTDIINLFLVLLGLGDD